MIYIYQVHLVILCMSLHAPALDGFLYCLDIPALPSVLGPYKIIMLLYTFDDGIIKRERNSALKNETMNCDPLRRHIT